MRNFIQSLARDESGVTAVEYAVLAGVVVLIIAAGGQAFGDALGALFTALGTELTGIATDIGS